MKKIISFIALALLALSCTHKPFPLVEEFVLCADDLTPADVEVKGATQGFAIWDNYGFILHDNGQCVVVDLDSKEFVSTFNLQDNKSHCNSANWGREMGSKGFPLLYVSECKGESRCLVTDIGLDSGEIVQKIHFDGTAYPSLYDWVVDLDNNSIWLRGSINKYYMQNPPDSTRGKWYCFTRLPLPTLADSDERGEVHLTDDDIIEQFYYDEVYVGQGSTIWDGCYFTGEGFVAEGIKARIHIFDVNKGKRIQIKDVTSLHLEPEGMAIKDDYLYVLYHTPKEARKSMIYRYSLK